MPEFTESETRLMRVLGDGMPHSMTELRAVMLDDMASPKAIRAHLVRIRRKLSPRGEDIICQVVNRAFKYRLVRLITQSE